MARNRAAHDPVRRGGHMFYREDAKSAFCGIAGGHSRGLLSHELPRRRFSIAVSTWRPTDIWYSRRYCARCGSSSAKWWVSGCCVLQTASCAASPTAIRKSSSFMPPRSVCHNRSTAISPTTCHYSSTYPVIFHMKPVLSNCYRWRFLAGRSSSKNGRSGSPVNFLRGISFRRLMT